ncbi:MAG TPA: radical SAM protein [Candidatus Margulisiibacteriota bacterium]|nr:radical SAM protein [Candidatus Margulisiibacteriota bacterium]
MAADVVLVNPFPNAAGTNDVTVQAPMGLLYIASSLESRGYSCNLVDANALKLDDEHAVSLCLKEDPLLVGMHVNALNFQAAMRYSRIIKEQGPKIKIVFGGPHATASAQACLAPGTVDGVVCAEGERICVDIIGRIKKNAHPFEGLLGVCYMDNGAFVRNPPAERIEDIDNLPIPAYHLLPGLNNYKTRVRRWPFMGIITSRGCPYRCSFCSKDIFGTKITLRSPENVVSEIEFLIRSMGIRQIDILDDNFTFDRQRCENICRLLIKKSLPVILNLQSGVRTETIDKEMLILLKKAGVFKIAFGVESGDEDILRAVDKRVNLDQIRKTVKLARQTGMVTIGFFMLGLPYDTEHSMQKTIDIAKELNCHIANFMITIPFYGTPLYDLVQEKGRMLVDTREGISSGFYGGKAFFEFQGMTAGMVEHYYKKAYRDFYNRPSKLMDILSTIRSFGELRWLLEAGFSIIASGIKKG